jgi:RNA polymerase sigma-70 factor (ECF subfamily)
VPDERRASFDAFVRAHGGPLFGQAYLLTGQYHEAQDLVQETFIRVWQHWGRVEGYEDPLGFARHVLHNIAVSRWRKHGRRATVPETEIPVPSPDVGHLDVVQALSLLPERQRRAIVLHDVTGLSVSEIAREMGAAEGSVRSWLSRGRATLAVHLGTAEPEAAPPA